MHIRVGRFDCKICRRVRRNRNNETIVRSVVDTCSRWQYLPNSRGGSADSSRAFLEHGDLTAEVLLLPSCDRRDLRCMHVRMYTYMYMHARDCTQWARLVFQN